MPHLLVLSVPQVCEPQFGWQGSLKPLIHRDILCGDSETQGENPESPQAGPPQLGLVTSKSYGSKEKVQSLDTLTKYPVVYSFWAAIFCCHFRWEFSLSTCLKETQSKQHLLFLKTLHFFPRRRCSFFIRSDSIFRWKYLQNSTTI